MGRVFDLLEAALVDIVDSDGTKILDKWHMMNIFKELLNELVPFQECHDHMFEEKKSFVVGSREKVIPCQLL